MNGKPKHLILLAVLVGIAAGWGLFFYPVTVLQFENTDRSGKTQILIAPGERFSITYHHSIYDQPVTEEFVIASDNAIVLTGLRSKSGAVLEYFGLAEEGEYHPMQRKMTVIVFRVAVSVPAQMTIGGKWFSFFDFGQHGDRIKAEVVSVACGEYLATRIKQRLRRLG